MRSGSMDRRIDIQTATRSQDASGQEIETWSVLVTIWAERKDMRASERFAAEQRLAVRTCIFRIRWRAGLTERMRVVDGETTYDVTGIAGDNRAGWCELACEAINPEAV